MPAPQLSPVVIACPHCGTRYQLAYATIGAKGRTVQCAHCGKSWQAHVEPPPGFPSPPMPPDPPVTKDFAALAEDALDEKFLEEERRHQKRREATRRGVERPDAAAAAGSSPAADGDPRSDEHQRTLEEIRAAIAPKPSEEKIDPVARQRQQLEFSKRQRSVYSKLPAARFRRASRVGAVAALAVLLVGGIALRFQIVQVFPQLAGVYAAIGLGVNVVGLEFRDVHTLQSLQHGAEVLVVDGRIASVANGEVPVPPIIVTLLGPHHQPLYEWSVLPRVGDLAPDETVAFHTQLSKPPDGAADVKLRFGTGQAAPTVADGALPIDGGESVEAPDGAAPVSATNPAVSPDTDPAPQASARKADDGQNSAR